VRVSKPHLVIEWNPPPIEREKEKEREEERVREIERKKER
jgi:hypothetical protein